MNAGQLPLQNYIVLDDAECETRITAARKALGRRCVILGHHYQRDEVFRHADITGDSLKLSREAARSDADYIVFCGVHFMAEVADILSRPGQVSILPDLAAGCSMADMANLEAVESSWQELATVLDPDTAITPVTYINSAADLKAFCGRHGGIVCTSSNARAVLDWSFSRREKILFFPDEHLGRNTALRMGMQDDDFAVWDFSRPMGGLTPEQISRARMLLWKGYCSVHQMFLPEHVERFRASHPDCRVIVHPECSAEVCRLADEVGSTEFILNTVRAAGSGQRWLVGTELNLVNRLAAEMKPMGTEVHFLSPVICMCSTMFRTDPQHLLWVLENLVEGHVVNRIQVDSLTAEQARSTLDRMLEVVG